MSMDEMIKIIRQEYAEVVEALKKGRTGTQCR